MDRNGLDNAFDGRWLLPGCHGVAQWDIIHACNYRCPYCFFIPSWEKDPVTTNQRHLGLAPHDWLSFWHRIHDLYGPFQIGIGGGEPFLYPQFVALVAELSREHYVGVITNLSGNLDEILRSWNPERVYSIGPSFHPHHTAIEAFLPKVQRLKEAGFQVRPTVVAYPEFFGRLKEFLRRFDEAGVLSSVLPFRGVYGGRPYPQSYSPEEKAFFREADRLPENFAAYMIGKKSPFGKPCRTGHRYFRANPDGQVYRCSQENDLPDGRPVGHIKDKDFRLFPEPRPCPATTCECYGELRWLVEFCPSEDSLTRTR